MNIEKVAEGFELMEKGMSILRGGPLDYYVTRLTDCYQLLLDKFAPFKVGERVCLTKDWKPDKLPHGWSGAECFLVKGAVGTVRGVDCDKHGFSADVEFDDEAWIDPRTKQRHVTEPRFRHTYGFREHWLVRIPEGATPQRISTEEKDNG